jgi:arsenical pump membrane protein
MLYTLLGGALFLTTLALVMLRPHNLSEAVVASSGALLMLLLGFVGPGEVIQVLAGQWNVFGFFLGLMVISAVADQAGFFDALALGAARAARGDARRLYLAVFVIGILITAFLSNDATALILTPVIYTLVTRLRLSVLPFMFACTFIADTASFLLPVSNPINILVDSAFGLGLDPFVSHLLLPALLCIVVNIGIFLWRFRTELRGSYALADLDMAPAPTRDRHFFGFAVGCLTLIAGCYVLASAAGWPLSIVALGGGLLLIGGAVSFRQLDWRALGREIAWSIFPFIGGMFILVRGVENVHLTQAFGAFLLSLGGQGSLGAILITTFGAAIGANLVNNVPMALIMISAIQQQPALATPIQHGAIYATILGADLGPNLTTVGSLATMLWLLILRRKGLEISTREYLKLGVTVVPVMLIGGTLLIWLRL